MLLTQTNVLDTHSSCRAVKLSQASKSREILATAKSKDMPVDLRLIKRSHKIICLDKIKYLFKSRHCFRAKSATLKNRMVLTNYVLLHPPRHPPMIPAPTEAIPTLRIRIWPKILTFQPLPEHQRANSYIPTITMSETIFLLSPGRWHTTAITSIISTVSTSAMTSRASHTQLKQPALKRRSSTTKRSDLNSTKKSRKWKRQRCAETSSCTNTANMVMPVLTPTTWKS